jgi:6-phosphogluconolactonase
VTLDPTGRFVLTANYGSGSVSVYPVEAGGRLGEMADHVQHTGSGPNSERQESAHTHMIAFDPVTEGVLVADLGADTIFTYTLDPAGRLVPGAPLKTPAGAGPRHLAFHPDGRHLFVTHELGGAVATLRRDGDGFAPVGTTPTVPPGTDVDNLPAAIRVTPSGRHVLASNRGHDSIAVFAFGAYGASGAPGLSLVGTTPTGAYPRDFILTPDGRRVVVASQDSDVIASYDHDDDTGALRLLDQVSALTPVCLVLV